MRTLCILFIIKFTCYSVVAPQQPEINDQFETVPLKSTTTETITEGSINGIEDYKPITYEIKPIYRIIGSLYRILKLQLQKLVYAPKIRAVLRNIGTCIVNGAMEIISHYFPAPIIPLITTAAGMVIPFEPVVMLKRRIPVTSYRRAISTALSTFLNTFNGYKMDYDEDPYMTRRFNRRFGNDLDAKPVL